MRCLICYEVIVDSDTSHVDSCRETQIRLLEQFDSVPDPNSESEGKSNSVPVQATPVRLTPIQQQALTYVKRKSRPFAQQTRFNLQSRLIRLDLGPNQVDQILARMRDCPVIIHVNLQRNLRHLVNDTHYRNLFETGSSGGCRVLGQRNSWEGKLFNGIYENADPIERVKYGSLNLFQDIRGVRCCYPYGDSYLELRPEVKDRCSFVFGDSSKQEMHIATFDNMSHILLYVTDQNLRDFVKLSTENLGSRKNSDSHLTEYIEVQIHGPVDLRRDVSRLVVNNRYRHDSEICDLLDMYRHGPVVWM